MTYKVEIDVYNGPLDLLLYLIKRDEIEIDQIEVARLADQYIAYVEALQALDIELAADFLVMAATLVEMKSRAVLPRPPAVEDEEDLDEDEDPRETLIRQLIEYRRFKEVAGQLGERGDEMERRFARQVDERLLKRIADGEADEPLPQDLFEGVEVWDLFSAFTHVVRTLGYTRPRDVVYDDTPVEEAADRLVERLTSLGSLRFTDLFEKEGGLGEAITTFLAILELARQRRLGIEQDEDFRDMRLYLRDPDEAPSAPTRPKGAAASADGLKRKRPRRPTAAQAEALEAIRQDTEVEKTEFDEILDRIEVPEVDVHHPIYTDAELLGRAGEPSDGEDAETPEADATADADEDPAAPPAPEAAQTAPETADEAEERPEGAA